MTDEVKLRALRGFRNKGQTVKRGKIFSRSRDVADSLINSKLAEEVPTPIQAMVRAAHDLGVGLVVAEGTTNVDEILSEAATAQVGVVDNRPKKPGRPRKTESE